MLFQNNAPRGREFRGHKVVQKSEHVFENSKITNSVTNSMFVRDGTSYRDRTAKPKPKIFVAAEKMHLVGDMRPSRMLASYGCSLDVVAIYWVVDTMGNSTTLTQKTLVAQFRFLRPTLALEAASTSVCPHEMIRFLPLSLSR